MNKKYLIIIVILSFVALWPFFKSGYFTSHDGEWMVIRFSAFHQTLSSGQFPVRFVDRLNNNYGYPVLNFLYPLPFYLSELPKVLGFGFVDSIKIITVLATILSAFGMYWAARQKFSQDASLTAAVVYLFAPYRFVDLYVRGSLGENIAFTVLPFVLGSIFKISNGEKRYLLLLAIFIAALVLSHNVIALLFLPFFLVLIYIVVKKDLLLQTLAIFILGIFIASFFWISAIYDLQFVRMSQIKVSDAVAHLVPVNKLIYSTWNFGPIPSQSDGFSAQVGVLSLLILASFIYVKIRLKSYNKLSHFLVATYFVSLFLITPYSKFIWQNIPFLDIIQFPWRILSIIVFVTAILAAVLVESLGKLKISILICLAAILATFQFIRPFSFIDRGDGYYSTNEDTTTVKDEYLPVWTASRLPRADQKLSPDPNVTVLDSSVKSAFYSYKLDIAEDTTATVNTIYYPKFTATIDNRIVPVNTTESGLISFQLPKGTHEVIIKYGRSPIHLASEIISLTALGLTILLIINLWRRKNI